MEDDDAAGAAPGGTTDTASAVAAVTSPLVPSVIKLALGFIGHPIETETNPWHLVTKAQLRVAALSLIAVGRGPARVQTCHHALWGVTAQSTRSRTILRRALSLFGPEEVQELRSFDSERVSKLILSLLKKEDALHPSARQLTRAFKSLRVVETKYMRAKYDEEETACSALIKRCAATLTEINCWDMFTGDADDTLSRCKNLQSLTMLARTSSALMGLSQLHTLCDVSFEMVPVAVIAALKQLKELHVSHPEPVVFCLDGFFDVVLPRLRAFGLYGYWTEVNDEGASEVLPLPDLEELHWCSISYLPDDWPALPRGCMGGQPLTLDTHIHAISAWADTFDAMRPGAPITESPLARLHTLTLTCGPDGDARIEAPEIAWALRAAPQLRQLTLHVDILTPPWLLSATAEPFVEELVQHPRVRRVAFTCDDETNYWSGPATDCGVRLRQLHFPRLRRCTVYDKQYPVYGFEDTLSGL